MKAVKEYKKAIDDLDHLFMVFSNVGTFPAFALKEWTIDNVNGYAAGTMRYRPDEKIKDELIGDAPDKETLKRRLAYIDFELIHNLPEPDTYFHIYDEAFYNIDNKELVEALTKVNGENWAFSIVQQLNNAAVWANIRIKATWQMLENLKEYAGYEQTTIHQPETPPEPQQVLKDFVTDEAKQMFSKALDKRLVSVDGEKYRWEDTASLYGYFVDMTSNYLNIRNSNDRIPWKKYEAIITNHTCLLATAKQAVNDYKNKELNPPEGDDKVNDICR